MAVVSGSDGGDCAFTEPLGAGYGFQQDRIHGKTDHAESLMISGSPNVDVNHPDAAGGLVGVLAGPDGIFMVDAQYAQVSEKLLAAIKKISSAPIRFMANTHIHGDHTAGNPFFGKMGVVIFAREELREQMLRPPAKDAAGFPVVTYGMGAPVKFHLNGEVINLIPVRAAHTSGDTIIQFEKANVIMIGDFYRNTGIHLSTAPTAARSTACSKAAIN